MKRVGEVVQRVKHIDHPVVCEIGIFKGRMSSMLVERHPMTLYMIDPWSSDYDDTYKDTGDFHAGLSLHDQNRYYRMAKDAVQGFDAHIVRKFSSQAANDFEDGFFDLVFIDGDHSYRGVKEDIENYAPKVKKGGYIGGHDYANFDGDWKFGVSVCQAVNEFIEEKGLKLELGEDYTWFAQL